MPVMSRGDQLVQALTPGQIPLGLRRNRDAGQDAALRAGLTGEQVRRGRLAGRAELD
jgi:hypothetical protein